MHGDDTARAGYAGSPQHRLDLDRMVAVVVEDGHAVPGPRQREAALDAAERGKPLADILLGNAEPVGHGDRRGRVRDIVTARHRQRQILEAEHPTGAAAADLDVEDRSEEHTSELQSLMRISYAVFC